MATANNAIATGECDAMNSRVYKRLENGRKARVKNVCEGATAGSFVGDAGETRGREVSQKNLSEAEGFPTGVLGEISDRHVHGSLIFEDGRLSLVR